MVYGTLGKVHKINNVISKIEHAMLDDIYTYEWFREILNQKHIIDSIKLTEIGVVANPKTITLSSELRNTS